LGAEGWVEGRDIAAVDQREFECQVKGLKILKIIGVIIGL
jgi:hypothetical protein